MNTLLELLQQPLARRLGWTLLHFLWQGGLLAVFFLVARGALHRRSPNARYLAGCLTLLLMAAAPVVTFRALDVTPALHQAAAVAATLPSVVPAVAPAGGARPSFDGLARVAVWLDGLIEAALPWLVGAWAAGVFALSSRLGVGWFQVRRLRRRSVEPLDERLLAQLAALQRRLGVSRPVRLLKSALVEVPTVIGWFRPVILLPASTITGLSPLQLELILAHELAHLRRGDYWVNLFQILLETLLFYHPAVWWVSRCVRQDREHCCDDLAVVACGNRLAYAQALATLEELRQPPANVAFAASGGSLLARIKHVLGLPAETTPSGWRRSVGGALIALGLLAIAGGAVMMVAPTRYRSTAVISVRKDTEDMGSAPNREASDPYLVAFVMERIESEKVLNLAIERADLQNKWAVRYNRGKKLSEREAFDLLLQRLEVRHPSPTTRLVQIRVVDEDKELAAKVANKIAESYQHARSMIPLGLAIEKLANLKGNLSMLENEVSMRQSDLNTLREKLGISESAAGPGQSDQGALGRERVSTLAQLLESARAEYVLANSKLEGLQKFDRKTLRAVAPTVVSGEQLLPQLLADLNSAEQKLAQLRTDSADGAPEVVRAEALRQRIDSQIEARLDGILMGLASQVTALKARRDALEKELAEARVAAIEQPAKEQDYRALRSRLEIDEKVRDAVALQMRQADLAKDRLETDVEIVDWAEPGLRPVSPNRPLAGALSVSGLLLIFAGVSLRRRGPAVELPAAG